MIANIKLANSIKCLIGLNGFGDWDLSITVSWINCKRVYKKQSPPETSIQIGIKGWMVHLFKFTNPVLINAINITIPKNKPKTVDTTDS